jgi:hypothetical protein
MITTLAFDGNASMLSASLPDTGHKRADGALLTGHFTMILPAIDEFTRFFQANEIFWRNFTASLLLLQGQAPCIRRAGVLNCRKAGNTFASAETAP